MENNEQPKEKKSFTKQIIILIAFSVYLIFGWEVGQFAYHAFTDNQEEENNIEKCLENGGEIIGEFCAGALINKPQEPTITIPLKEPVEDYEYDCSGAKRTNDCIKIVNQITIKELPVSEVVKMIVEFDGLRYVPGKTTEIPAKLSK